MNDRLKLSKVPGERAMKHQTKIVLSLDSDQYDNLIDVANDLRMTSYALIRKLIDYAIIEHSTKGDKTNTDGRS